MNQRLVIVVDHEKPDTNGVIQKYSFSFPYGAQASDIFSVLNEIGQGLDEHVKEIIAQQEAEKTKETESVSTLEPELVG